LNITAEKNFSKNKLSAGLPDCERNPAALLNEATGLRSQSGGLAKRGYRHFPHSFMVKDH
jgi:hypothetical protein